MPQSLAVTSDEEDFLTNGNLEAFWYSRLKKRDPVARTGYALWVSDTDSSVWYGIALRDERLQGIA